MNLHLHPDGKPVRHVEFNDGTTEDIFALVKKHNDDGTSNLQVFPDEGACYPANSIPRREKADYGPEGGGQTYHVSE